MTFEDLLNDDRPHVFDGAMGTMLYQKGVFINRCYDELTLTDPDVVRDIHRAYIKAGAELIETNSFGANEVQLGEYDLQHLVTDINVRAAQIAREAAGDRILVGGVLVELVAEVGRALHGSGLWVA